jgi:hypothetical protein
MTTSMIECDIAVIGGGLGGCAAALRACRSGRRVCLTEETTWLGGQATSQGVSALDEHSLIESLGAPATYYEWRESIRDLYRERYALSAAACDAPYFNPGDAWVSRLCFEPAVGVLALVGLLLPEVEAGRLQILYRTRPVGVDVDGDRLSVVHLRDDEGAETQVRASWVLDATELGDLLPLAGTPWVTGAEARDETGEPAAREQGPAPHLTQTWTLPFAVDLRPGEDHTIEPPADYARLRDEQPFTLTMTYGTRDLTYKVFDPVPDLPGAFWTYRRLVAAGQFVPGQVAGDLAMINWAGNDFAGGDLVAASETERQTLIARAGELSRGLLYWLQTEVPRDDGAGRGYPEIRLRTDVMGTDDGLAMRPYIREGRRIRAQTTVRQQDVAASCRDSARARLYSDSLGVGWYPIDIHPQPGDVATTEPTVPFQIPLGALLPVGGPVNLLPACKNIGTTHLTNGCYRVHPVEWGIGEAAGSLAVFCLDEGVSATTVRDDEVRLRRLQARLTATGVPLYWFSDVPATHEAFDAVQRLATADLWPGAPADLAFRPDEPLTGDDRRVLARHMPADLPLDDLLAGEGLTRASAAIRLQERLGA